MICIINLKHIPKRKNPFMNKKLVYIIIVVVLGCFKSKAQDTLIPLSKLKNETLYNFDYGVLKNVENDSYFSTLLENEITVDVLTEYAHKYPQMVDTNPVLFANIKSNSFKISHNRKIINKYDLDTIDKNKVYRLMLIGTYPDSIEFSKLNFPNLQELHMYRNGTFPKDISIYINLQILDVDQLYGEIFVDYSAPLQIAILDTMGYKIPSVFPEEIYRLPHLKVLYFDVEKGTYVTLSEKVNELKQLDASYVHDYYNQLYIPVSLLQYHNFNVKQILGFGETANGYWKRNPRKKIEEVEVFNTRSTKYKTHRMLFGTCKYIQKYNNGNLMIQGRFEKRKPVGKWTMWYENGHICQERFYKDGVEDSVWTFWNRKDSSKTKYNSYNNDTIRYQIYFTK